MWPHWKEGHRSSDTWQPGCCGKSKQTGWSDGAAAYGPGCSCRVPGFDPQFPHRWLTTTRSPVPEDPMVFSGLRGHLHTYGTHGYVQAHVYTHKTKGKSFLKSLDRGQGTAL